MFHSDVKLSWSCVKLHSRCCSWWLAFRNLPELLQVSDMRMIFRQRNIISQLATPVAVTESKWKPVKICEIGVTLIIFDHFWFAFHGFRAWFSQGAQWPAAAVGSTGGCCERLRRTASAGPAAVPLPRSNARVAPWHHRPLKKTAAGLHVEHILYIDLYMCVFILWLMFWWLFRQFCSCCTSRLCWH